MDRHKIADKVAKNILAQPDMISDRVATEYQKFFQKKLKKFNVSSPTELEGDQKKKFYDEVDAGWKSDNESD